MPIDDLTALGDALRAARKEKNLTQEQLAEYYPAWEPPVSCLRATLELLS